MAQQNLPIRLIVGLGNPGPDYVRTRHNAGFRFVDMLAGKLGAHFHEERKFQGETARCRIAGTIPISGSFHARPPSSFGW